MARRSNIPEETTVYLTELVRNECAALKMPVPEVRIFEGSKGGPVAQATGNVDSKRGHTCPDGTMFLQRRLHTDFDSRQARWVIRHELGHVREQRIEAEVARKSGKSRTRSAQAERDILKPRNIIGLFLVGAFPRANKFTRAMRRLPGVSACVEAAVRAAAAIRLDEVSADAFATKTAAQARDGRRLVLALVEEGYPGLGDDVKAVREAEGAPEPVDESVALAKRLTLLGKWERNHEAREARSAATPPTDAAVGLA